MNEGHSEIRLKMIAAKIGKEIDNEDKTKLQRKTTIIIEHGSGNIRRIAVDRSETTYNVK